jgi:hypothetical protein
VLARINDRRYGSSLAPQYRTIQRNVCAVENQVGVPRLVAKVALKQGVTWRVRTRAVELSDGLERTIVTNSALQLHGVGDSEAAFWLVITHDSVPIHSAVIVTANVGISDVHLA